VVAEVLTVHETRDGHDPQPGRPQPVQFGEAFWDERYSSAETLWSGNPNRYLVSEASDLDPGTALDAGCGEGADALWLAGRGWRVTGADLSAVALGRAARHAAQAGPGIAARVDWVHADLAGWDPGPARYGLVSSQYVHLPPGAREALFRALAGAVAPGGSLLVVGHHPSDLQTTMRRPPMPELFFTGSDIAPLLDSGDWKIITDEAPQRSAPDPDGRPVMIRDTVFRARRGG
jgi:SAM-dependent methyltransferase